MKLTNIKRLSFISVLALLATPAHSAAPAPTYGSVASVNVALTLTRFAPGTVQREPEGKIILDADKKPIPADSSSYTITTGKGDNTVSTAYEEYVVKAVTSKYSTKELLLDLMDAQVIPNTATNPAERLVAIKGWSIVQVTSFVTYPEHILGLSESYPVLFAYKKGEPAVNLDSKVMIYSGAGRTPVNLKSSTATKASDPENPVTSVVFSRSETCRGSFRVSLTNNQPRSFFADGLYTSTAKLGRAKDKTPVIFRGAAKISNVVGALHEAENSDSLVTGSVSIAAGIITPDITATFDLNLR